MSTGLPLLASLLASSSLDGREDLCLLGVKEPRLPCVEEREARGKRGRLKLSKQDQADGICALLSRDLLMGTCARDLGSVGRGSAMTLSTTRTHPRWNQVVVPLGPQIKGMLYQGRVGLAAGGYASVGILQAVAAGLPLSSTPQRNACCSGVFTSGRPATRVLLARVALDRLAACPTIADAMAHTARSTANWERVESWGGKR